jgi:hypothetical protein
VSGTGRGFAAGRAVVVGVTAVGPGPAAGPGADPDLEMVSAPAAGEPLLVVIASEDSTMAASCPVADMAARTPSGAGVVEFVALVVMEAALEVEVAFGVAAQHKRHSAQDRRAGPEWGHLVVTVRMQLQ